MKSLSTPHQYQILSFLAGAVALSVLSVFQKAIISAPLTIEGFIVPVVYGGISGSLIGIWAERLKRQNRQLNELIVARQWMLRDLHHRIENNLQVVSSVLGLELEGCDDCGVGSASRLRIDLLASIHQALYEMNAQYEIDLRELLERHLRAVHGRFCGGVDGGQASPAGARHLHGRPGRAASSDANHHSFSAGPGPGDRSLPGEAATPQLLVPLDTAVVVTMIVNEMIAECEGYWNCELESSLSVACSGDRDRCEVRVHLPAAVVNRVPDYRADSDRIRFRDTLVRTLADQICAEATVTWEPELSGTISFVPAEQRQYGAAAAGAPGAGIGAATRRG